MTDCFTSLGPGCRQGGEESISPGYLSGKKAGLGRGCVKVKTTLAQGGGDTEAQGFLSPRLTALLKGWLAIDSAASRRWLLVEARIYHPVS